MCYINRNGKYFKVEVKNKRGHLISARQLKEKLQYVVNLAGDDVDERFIAALTAQDRPTWAKVCTVFFTCIVCTYCGYVRTYIPLGYCFLHCMQCSHYLYKTCVLECYCGVANLCGDQTDCHCACVSSPLHWLQQRKALEADPANRQVLQAIDSALCFIALENEPSGDVNALANKAFHGNGRNTWFDKACTVVFYTNGRHTGNIEHSFLDATVSPVHL